MKKKPSRKLLDTDIVYSAKGVDGSVRFALQPLPDCLPFMARHRTEAKHGDLPFRAVISPAGERGNVYASCRSHGCVAGADALYAAEPEPDSGPWITPGGRPRQWDAHESDGWLHWLAGDDAGDAE